MRLYPFWARFASLHRCLVIRTFDLFSQSGAVLYKYMSGMEGRVRGLVFSVYIWSRVSRRKLKARANEASVEKLKMSSSGERWEIY